MKALYDSKSKTIDDRGLKNLFTEKEKYKTWLLFESALAEAQAEYGLIPKKLRRKLKMPPNLKTLISKKWTVFTKKLVMALSLF